MNRLQRGPESIDLTTVCLLAARASSRVFTTLSVLGRKLHLTPSQHEPALDQFGAYAFSHNDAAQSGTRDLDHSSPIKVHLADTVN